jgi:hypothetical protein
MSLIIGVIMSFEVGAIESYLSAKVVGRVPSP